tara:strand:- start:6598 stop:7686 length:1089 start_codon:yes stop_codon:yes gene_type:complete
MTDRKDGIWIFGTAPEPIGGVAVFVSRLISSSKVPIIGLLDPYFGDQKSVLPVPHWVPRKNGLWHKFLILLSLARLRNRLLFINGSRAESVIGLMPFLVFRHAPRSLLLHHGDLFSSLRGSWFKTVLARYALRGYSRIFCLSENQRRFYMSHGVKPSRLSLVNSHIASAEDDSGRNLSQQAIDVLEWIAEAPEKVIVGSGYANPFYNHDWVVDFLAQNDHFKNSRYILCCYGPKTEYLAQLQDKFSALPNAKLCFGLLPHEFDMVLSRCDIYVRPTSVDSFGIAIHDALAMGLNVIASDACERPNGAFVHQVDDAEGFANILAECLENETAEKIKQPTRDGGFSDRTDITDALNDFVSKAGA